MICFFTEDVSFVVCADTLKKKKRNKNKNEKTFLVCFFNK